MTRVAFVFTNPRHHFEMMSPVARELGKRGVDTVFWSLAELRGLESPTSDLDIVRVIPFNLRRRTSSIGVGIGADASTRRRVLQQVVWMGLAARLWPLARTVDLVVVPNDAVFPYTELIEWCARRGIPYVLMQEGIRFPLPAQYAPYGAGGAAAVCAWGEGSAEYFREAGAAASSIVVTGSPRFDKVIPAEWTTRGEQLRATLGLATAPVVFLSNPIEIQGFGTRDFKLGLFERFLDEVAPVLEARHIPILVKLHAHESVDDFARVAAKTRAAAHVQIAPPDVPLYATIAAARGALVLASTVGLEALMFDVPLGVLQIPGHSFAFEYVQRGAAVAFREGAMASAFEQLLAPTADTREKARALVDRHLHDRGHAVERVAEAITDVLAAQRAA